MQLVSKNGEILSVSLLLWVDALKPTAGAMLLNVGFVVGRTVKL